MNPLGVLGLILLLSLLGTVAGLATGLVPGIHVNNVALLVLAASPAILGSLEASVGGEGVLLLAAFLVAASAAHGMSSLLPSVFLGAPDEDTALSVLPGHRLLVQGRGYEAVLLAARGALLATFLAIPMLLPFRLLLGSPVNGYAKLRPVLPLVLLLLVVLLVAMEGRSSEEPSRRLRKRAWAVGLLLLAGLLGWIVLRPGVLEDAWVPVPVAGGSLILFPLFTGLFGLPTLLMAARTRGRLPPQILGPADPLPDWRRTRAVLSGTLAGAAVSWFPGLGGSNATVVAQLLAGGEPQEDPDADREFLLAAGAASAATTVFTFATLFVILRARSGVAAAVDAIASGASTWEPLDNPPLLFLAVLISLFVGVLVAYVATVRLARPFAILAGRVRYGRFAALTAFGLALAVGLVTGPVGLAVLGTAASLGLVPPLVGVRRVHLMGCLLVPILAGSL